MLWRLTLALSILAASHALVAAELPPRLLKARFTADAADPDATQALGLQQAFVDGRVPTQGRLVIFLHGAGRNEKCGPVAHLRLLAGFGFHVFSPCYVSDYGVDNCGSDIRGCRLEAFEGIDHHPYVRIAPADAIERRVARGLRHLETLQPEADWGRFLDSDGRPDWSQIILTGHSHGASTAALIGMVRRVGRVVMLAGPYDPGQAWLEQTGLTPVSDYYGLSHVGDRQHSGHLEAFALLGLSGPVVNVDRSQPPYGGSHQLVTSVESGNPHSAVRAGKPSPKRGERFALELAWRYLYGLSD